MESDKELMIQTSCQHSSLEGVEIEGSRKLFCVTYFPVHILSFLCVVLENADILTAFIARNVMILCSPLI